MDVLKIYQVKLIYLGDNKFGKLIEKPGTSAHSYLSANYNYLPMLQQPAPPPLIRELETANTLLDLQTHGAAMVSQEPPVFEGPPVPETANAMDKIVGRFDVCQSTVWSLHDAMDKIVSEDPIQMTLNVETADSAVTPMVHLDIIPVQQPALNVKTLNLRMCHVCITLLEDIVFDKPDSKPPPAPIAEPNDLPVGERYT